MPEGIDPSVMNNLEAAWSFYLVGPDEAGRYSAGSKTEVNLDGQPQQNKVGTITIIRYQTDNQVKFAILGKNFADSPQPQTDKRIKMALVPDMMTEFANRLQPPKPTPPPQPPIEPVVLPPDQPRQPARQVIEDVATRTGPAQEMPVPAPIQEIIDACSKEKLRLNQQLSPLLKELFKSRRLEGLFIEYPISF